MLNIVMERGINRMEGKGFWVIDFQFLCQLTYVSCYRERQREAEELERILQLSLLEK